MSTIIRELTDIQGVTVGAPTENAFTATGIETFANDAAYEAAHPTPGAGELYFNTTEKAQRTYNGTAWQSEKGLYSCQTDAASTGANVDLAPNTVDQIVLFTHGSLSSIRSINPANQKLIHLYNGQASNGITLVNESAGGTAANRILTGNGADFVLQTKQIVSLVYDTVATRWRILSKPITGIESFANDAAYVTAHNPPQAGGRYWNTTLSCTREYDGSDWQNNKVLFATEVNSSITGSAAEVTPGRSQIIKVTNASLTAIRGVAALLQGFIILINGTGATITIKNEDSGASANDRVITGTGVDLSIENGASIILAYDTDSTRWRVTGGSGSGGGGSSGINLCTSPNDIIGWYSSAATAATTTTTAAECPLYPLVPTAIKITRTTVGSYEEWRWEMPVALKNNTIPISWKQLVQTGMVSGEFKLDVYVYTDGTYSSGTRKTLRSDVSSVTSIPAYNGVFGSGNAVSFDTGSETYYGMRVPRVSGTNWLSIVDVKIGPGDNGIAASSGEYEQVATYTIGGTTTPPTPGTGATYLRNTTKDGRWAIIRYEYKHTGAGSAGSGDYLLPIPTGLTIDYTRVNTVGSNVASGVVGKGYLQAGTPTYEATGFVINGGAYINKIAVTISGDVTAPGTAWGSVNASLASTTIILGITVRVPIVGWDDSVLVGPGNICDYGSGAITSDANTSTYSLLPQGSRVPTASLTATRSVDITWPTPNQPDHKFDLEFDYNGDGRWVPIDSNEYGSLGYQQQNTNSYGMYLNHQSTTVTRVNFAVYAYASGATYGAAGSAWTALVATVRWRLRRWRSGLPAGIEHGQLHGGAQLYRAGYAPGLNTGATIAAGMIGERIDVSLANVALSVSGTSYNFGQTTLQPGVWMIIAQFFLGANGGASRSGAGLCINTAAAYADQHSVRSSNTAPGTGDSLQATRIINVGTATTIYVLGYLTYSGGSPTTDAAKSVLYAVRIA